MDVLHGVMGDCSDDAYCVVRDVLRDSNVLDFQEEMDAGGCGNNGGECRLYDKASKSRVPDREFMIGKVIARYAFDKGIENRKEARRLWVEEGHAEQFEVLWDKGIRTHKELYATIFGERQLFG